MCDEVREVQIALGVKSNDIAAHLFSLQEIPPNENLSDCLFMTTYSNAYPRLLSIDLPRPTSGFVTDAPVDWDHKMQLFDRSDESVKPPNEVFVWGRPIERCLHTRSLLDVQARAADFSSFFAGAEGGVIRSQQKEEYLDSFRFLAEECGTLSQISIVADLDGGFGGLCASLLTDICDEYPGYKTIYALNTAEESWPSTIQSQIGDTFNAPLFYSHALELGSLVVPLESQDDKGGSNLATIAAAIETTTGAYRRRREYQPISFSEVLSVATERGQRIMCTLEALFPYSGQYSCADTLDSLHSASSINPLMHNLSFPAALLATERRMKVFSNIISVRGETEIDMQKLFFSSGLNVRRCVHVESPLVLPSRFPTLSLGVGLREEGSCTVISAVGASDLSATYLRQLERKMAQARGSLKSQLEKANYCGNDIDSVRESLLCFADRYTS